MHPAAVLVHYRHAELTSRCLSSLLEHCPGLARIYIVDNSPGDGSLTNLQAQYSDERLCWLPQTENTGFGGGCNAGIQAALQDHCDSVLLLNNDAWVDTDIVAQFSHASAEYHHRALLTGYVREPDGRLWYAGGDFSLYTARASHYQQAFSEPQRVSFATGCLMWLPRSVLTAVTGFDPDYFLYLEDVDLSLRLSQAGLDMICLPDITVYHEPSSSTGGRASALSVYYQNRNRWLLLRRHGKGRHWLVFIPFYTLGLLKRLLTGQGRISLAALRDGLLGRWGRR